ncbi:MAG: amino acid adenylation domain-containing protein [Negativicutes bacterium]
MLKCYLNEETRTTENSGIIPAASAVDTYTVSPAQRGLYIVERMANAGNAWHIVVPVVIDGRLNKERLGWAIDEVVARHPALGTSFCMVDGEVQSKINAEARLKKVFKSVDELAIDTAIADFVQPFDLDVAPLIRVALLEITSTRHVLVLDVHQIVADQASVKILVQELFEIYDNTQLTPPALCYSDYADWYSQRISTGVLVQQETFWREQLHDELPVLNLATDHPRPSNRKYQGAKLVETIAMETVVKLEAIADRQGVSAEVLLLAAYKVLLARYSGQDDLIVGLPFANRSGSELEKMVGFLENMLPLRTKPDRSKLFSEYLRELDLSVRSMAENQEYLFDNIVEKLGVVRDGSRNPIYDTVFDIGQNVEITNPAGLILEYYEYDPQTARYDLALEVVKKQQGWSLQLRYDCNLYTAASARRFAQHYLCLLEALINGGVEQKLGTIDFIPAAERELLLNEFNANELAAPLERSFHGLFREQVKRTPDNTALVFKNSALSYRQLDEKTDRLAEILRQRGVSREVIVPIMLERSAEMLVAVLAVMKAGGAYLPLDIKYPQARLDYMLEDSNAAIILSQPSLRDKFARFGGEFIDVTDAVIYTDSTVDNIDVSDINQGSDLVAIIYTSGSTGLPKGTMLTHRGLINMCYSENRDNAMCDTDVVASYASFSFDGSIWSNFPPLLAGAAVDIVPDEIMMSFVDLNGYFEKHKVTLTLMTTQLCEQFAELVTNNSLRQMSTGGEKYKTFRPAHYRIVNSYGPTEATVLVTRFTIDKNYDNIPIGKPLANTKVYIVDQDFQLQPLGVPGELCVSGAQLARGYRNRPELTAEKFINNPFVEVCQVVELSQDNSNFSKMYRTGDLARWLPDGNLEYLGRIDQQVKIRGFRIEIGEIEQKIMEYPAVKEAVVVAREDSAGNKYLCGYFTAETMVELEQLKEFMANDLPGYMIPAFITQIDAMPINANGKIDKKALPDIGSNPDAGAGVEPATDIEKKIAQVWQEVLGVARISATDDFFAIGGNSIKAISAVARLQKFFVISINDFFNYPCLRTLAANIKPAADTLKVRLAEIALQVAEFDKPPAADPRYLERYISSMAEYERKNTWFEAADFSVIRQYRCVLVTGATGFLGVHITQYLLVERNCQVYVIVRGADASIAKTRLRAKFAYYFGEEFWQANNLDERLVVICGELHQPQFGLDEVVYGRLCADVEAVFHSAANVSHYGRYSELYEGNVQATLELLTFAKTGIKKDFHHISTMSVVYGDIAGCDYQVFTEYQTDIGQKFGSYYAETKLIAETAVEAARAEGLNTNIYRAGNIAFQERTGLYQENIETNAYYQKVQGFINIGMVPDKLDADEYAYVDRLAEAIVRLAERPAALNRTYHMQNPQLVKLSKILTAPELGLSVRAAGLGEFFDYLYENLDQPGFKPHVENVLTHMELMDEKAKDSTVVTVVMDMTLAVLAKIGFSWPVFDVRMMRPLVERALSERVQIMRDNAVLGTLEQQSLSALAGKAQMKLWKRRSEIIREGESCADVYLILNGYAQLLRSSVGGWQGMVGLVKKNEMIGMELAGAVDKSSFTVDATMGDTLVLALPQDLLREYGRSNPQLLLGMLKVMNDRVDKLARLVVSLG